MTTHKKRILVSGSNGLCGNAIRRLSQNYCDLYDFIYTARSSSKYHDEYICDLTKEEQVKQLYNKTKPNFVIHTGAKVGGVGGNLAQPADYFYQNILMNAFMIKYAVEYNIEKFIGFSSVCVFPKDLLELQEDQMHNGPPWSDNFAYANAKRMVDIHIQSIKKQFGVKNYTSLIPGNIFGKCFDKETEIITVDGIKNITDIKIGDKIYTLNPNTLEVEISNVIATQEFTTNKWINIKTTTAVDFKVTPGHKIFASSNKKSGFKIKEIEKYYEDNKYHLAILAHHKSLNIIEVYPTIFSLEKYIDVNHIRINNTVKDFKISKEIPIYYDPKDFLEFIGWYIAEGSCCVHGNQNSCIRISQRKTANPENYKLIEELLTRMKLPFYHDGNNFTFSSRLFANFILAEIGKDSLSVQIPKFIFNLDFPKSLRQILYDFMMKGDGSKTEGRYATTSSKLSNDFILLSFLLCLKANKDSAYKSKKDNHEILYRISRRFQQLNTNFTSNNITIENVNNEQSYCITTDTNHLIYAGRNGKFNWIHQCDLFNLEHCHVFPALVHKLYKAKYLGEEFKVWGDGKSMREFIYVDDLAKITLDLFLLEEMPERLIVSGEKEYSIKEIVNFLLKSADFQQNICWETSKPNGQRNRPTNKTIFKNYFPNFKFTDIELAIQETWNWFCKNYPNVRM